MHRFLLTSNAHFWICSEWMSPWEAKEYDASKIYAPEPMESEIQFSHIAKEQGNQTLDGVRSGAKEHDDASKISAPEPMESEIQIQFFRGAKEQGNQTLDDGRSGAYVASTTRRSGVQRNSWKRSINS
eukprot:793457_1